VGLTTAERVQAVVDYGFTERQARFLVLVMRHAGLCVKRQYAAFAGIANGGEKCNAFFDKLVGRGFAAAAECVHNRARLYHVYYKPLYHAIGEADSRYRRAVPARAAADRLIRLDAALTDPHLEWLTTRPEKRAYLQANMTSDHSDHSGKDVTQDAPEVAKQFPGTFPVGVDATGRVVLLYLATVPWTDDFRAFLLGHIGFLRVTSRWTMRLVFPQPLQRAIPAYETVVHEELRTPLPADAVADLKRYFFHRRRGTDLNAIPEVLRAFLNRCALSFAGPRFAHLYRRWLTEQDGAFTGLPADISETLGLRAD
jgi:hypothetical protein